MMQPLTPLHNVARLYQAHVIDGIELLEVAGRTLAASRSRAGRWYDLTEGTCACEDFRHGAWCDHWAAAIHLHIPPAAPGRAIHVTPGPLTRRLALAAIRREHQSTG